MCGQHTDGACVRACDTEGAVSTQEVTAPKAQEELHTHSTESSLFLQGTLSMMARDAQQQVGLDLFLCVLSYSPGVHLSSYILCCGSSPVFLLLRPMALCE